MPQQTIFGANEAAYQIHIHLRADPINPTGPTILMVETKGMKGQTQRQKGYRIVEQEADYLPTMVAAALEGYLYGDSWLAPFNAIENVHRQARNARLQAAKRP